MVYVVLNEIINKLETKGENRNEILNTLEFCPVNYLLQSANIYKDYESTTTPKRSYQLTGKEEVNGNQLLFVKKTNGEMTLLACFDDEEMEFYKNENDMDMNDGIQKIIEINEI